MIFSQPKTSSKINSKYFFEELILWKNTDQKKKKIDKVRERTSILPRSNHCIRVWKKTTQYCTSADRFRSLIPLIFGIPPLKNCDPWPLPPHPYSSPHLFQVWTSPQVCKHFWKPPQWQECRISAMSIQCQIYYESCALKTQTKPPGYLSGDQKYCCSRNLPWRAYKWETNLHKMCFAFF